MLAVDHKLSNEIECYLKPLRGSYLSTWSMTAEVKQTLALTFEPLPVQYLPAAICNRYVKDTITIPIFQRRASHENHARAAVVIKFGIARRLPHVWLLPILVCVENDVNALASYNILT